MNKKISHAIVVIILITAGITGVAWANPIVTDISLVSEKRISRTVYEYTFQATITNDDTARSNVQATLNSAGQGTSIIDGVINVGELTANQVKTSTDTFTIRQDRTFAFDRTALVWVFSSETTNVIPDSLGNLGKLTIFPKVIPTNQDTKVTVMIKIDNPIVFEDKLQLVRLDNAGNIQSILASFTDDGTQGDAVDGDLWYTTQVTINEEKSVKIPLRALATIKGSSNEVYSLIETIEVEVGADTSGLFAIIQNDRLMFHNSEGGLISERDISPTTQPLSDQTGEYLIYECHSAIPTKNQKYVGVLTSRFLDLDGPPQETDTSIPYGSTFSYLDANSVLWSKSLPPDSSTRYFVPDRNGYAAMFSADGNRVLLIEVQEDDTEPKIQIYDAKGILVKEYTSKIQVLVSSRISWNGRFVLLEGHISPSEGGKYGFEVFDIEFEQGLTQPLDFFAIRSYFVLEGTDGRFIVWSDGQAIYQLP